MHVTSIASRAAPRAGAEDGAYPIIRRKLHRLCLLRPRSSGRCLRREPLQTSLEDSDAGHITLPRCHPLSKLGEIKPPLRIRVVSCTR